MGLEVGGGGTEEEEEEEKEKIPLCESIGHRPLWGRCPAPTLHYNLDLPKQGTGTADHLTLLRLLLIMQNHFSKYPCWRDRYRFRYPQCQIFSLNAVYTYSTLRASPSLHVVF